jgi:putative ABC transport system permease protein
MHEGRFLDHRDIKNRERNVVVTKSLSKLLNWQVGNLIMLRNTPFNIVGIVEVGAGALDTELGDSGLMLGERTVFVPKTVTPYWETDQWSQSRTPGTQSWWPHRRSASPTVDAIFLQVPSLLNLSRVMSTTQRLLSQPDYLVKHFSLVSPESLIRGVKKLQNTISLTVGSITVLCLLLGGTTLLSLMMTNVRDRMSEIGLRRVLGASQWDIAVLFVLEACLITGAAASAATLVTHILLILASDALPIPIRLSWVSIFTPLIAAIILGMVFSYWPALYAARIMPSEALRSE